MTRKDTNLHAKGPRPNAISRPDSTWGFLLSLLLVVFSLGILGWFFAIQRGDNRASRGILIPSGLSFLLIISAWLGNDYAHLTSWLIGCWFISGLFGVFAWLNARDRINRRLKALGSSNYIYLENNKPINQVNILKQMKFYLKSTSQVWYVEFEEKPLMNPRDNILQTTICIPIEITDKPPYGILCNTETWGISAKDIQIYFLPDALFLETATHCRHIPFLSIDMTFSKKQNDQLDAIPQDTPIVGKTWLHTTVKGKPDMRYKYNPEVTTVLNGIINIELFDGHHLFLQTSNPVSAEHFVACWKNLKQLCK